MPPTTVSQLQAYTSPWLKASDLQGRAATVTVETATVEEIRQQTGQKEARIVVAFAGKSKRLICNKTQALTLADLAKTEVFENWRGLVVTLEPATTRSGQDTINIRRAPAPTASTTRSTTPAAAGQNEDVE
jgi:RNA polymerase subunit RPABC4/transcription elongation factor Spt4